MTKNSGGVKIQDFGPPLRPKKCFKQLKNGVGPKLTAISCKRSVSLLNDFYRNGTTGLPVKMVYLMRKLCERRVGEPFKGPMIPFLRSG